jgi:5-methylcytosine-specific restriction protein B
MVSTKEDAEVQACWFVGAMYSGYNDQLPRFLKDGIWENGYEDKYLEEVKSVQVGDRIAIKSAYNRKKDLPFDNRGHYVSVMAIKAIGTVTGNIGDGRTLQVDWESVAPPREWYFYTNRTTIWRVLPGHWATDALISYTFNNESQDYSMFRNQPYWSERFGDLGAGIDFIVNTIPQELLDGFKTWFENDEHIEKEDYYDGEFTYHKLSSMTDDQFVEYFVKFKKEGGMIQSNGARTVPQFQESIEAGISLFRQYMYEPLINTSFNPAVWLNKVRDFKGFGVSTASIYLNRINKDVYAVLNGKVRDGVKLISNRPLPVDDAKAYDILLGIQRQLIEEYEAFENFYQVDAFNHYIVAIAEGQKLVEEWKQAESYAEDDSEGLMLTAEAEPSSKSIEPYTVEDILKDGCFLDRQKLEMILERLRAKKNLILQGPPGTGKTWLAKRLAFALMEQRKGERVRAVQFHPNLSYEDFVRGWRPSGDGRLALVDGPFVEMVKAATKDLANKYVVVIEEINRGNPAQIFGEMLTLLEADKRKATEALELCYQRPHDEPIYIPENLYVVGTMNIADRSLALVDLALRRRFAFIDLEPMLGKTWQDWLHTQYNIDSDVLTEIEKRVKFLNDEISADTSLGSQFCVGHSYVTPSFGTVVSDAREWFRQVVDTEIGPLLDEYWFDAADRAEKAKVRLLEGF